MKYELFGKLPLLAKAEYARAICSGDTPVDKPPRAKARFWSSFGTLMPKLFADCTPLDTPIRSSNQTAGTFLL